MSYHFFLNDKLLDEMLRQIVKSGRTKIKKSIDEIKVRDSMIENTAEVS